MSVKLFVLELECSSIAEQHCPAQILMASIRDHDLLGQKEAHWHSP